MHKVLIDYKGLDLYCQIDDDGACEGAYTLDRYDHQRKKWKYKEVTDLFVEQAKDEIFAKAEEKHQEEERERAEGVE